MQTTFYINKLMALFVLIILLQGCVTFNTSEGIIHDGQYGHLDDVEALLIKGGDLNQRETRWPGRTPAIYASEYRMLKFLQLLIKYNANLNIKDSRGRTALHAAVLPVNYKSPELPLSYIKGYKKGDKAVDVVKALIAGGADIDAKTTPKNYTALFLASYRGYADRVKALIEGGANTKIPNSSNITPLDMACVKNRASVVKILLSYESNNQNLINSCLNRAALTDGYETAKILIEELGANINRTPTTGLHPAQMAAIKGNVKVLSYFLARMGYTSVAGNEHANDKYNIQLFLNEGLKMKEKEHKEKQRVAAEKARQKQAEAKEAQRKNSNSGFLAALGAATLGVAAGMDGSTAGRLGIAVGRDVNNGGTSNIDSFVKNRSSMMQDFNANLAKENKRYKSSNTSIAAQRKRLQQKPSLYQQQLNRIAGQTKNNTSSGKLANNRTVRIQPNKNTSLNSKKRNTSVASNSAKYRAPQATSSSSKRGSCSQLPEFKGRKVFPKVNKAVGKWKDKLTYESYARSNVWTEAKNDARKACRSVDNSSGIVMIGSKADAVCNEIPSSRLGGETWECKIETDFYCGCRNNASSSVR